MEHMNGKSLAIALIKKLAQAGEDPGELGGPPAPAPAGDDPGELGAPSTPPNSGSFFASPVVRAMQQQLQGLAQDVMSWVNISDMAKRQTGTSNKNDFSTKNYLSFPDP